jgi:nucleoside-triphosphatase THEP1
MTGQWTAIVGWGEQGREATTRRVVEALRSQGKRVGGCLQDKVIENDEIVGYDLIDLDGGERHALARPSEDPELCNWGFRHEVFDRIRKRVVDSDYDVVVLELGPIEARGRGHWPTVEALLDRDGSLPLLCIRPRSLSRIALELPDPVAGIELPASDGEFEDFVAELTR